MKILIIVPKSSGVTLGFTEFPIGLAYISAYLKARNHSVEVLDLNSYYMRLQPALIQMLLKRKILQFEPQMVCTGGLSAIYDQLHLLNHLVKSVDPQILAVLGGGCISSEPELVMTHIQADYGVIGEGEVTLAELVHHIETGASVDLVDGIIYRENNILKQTEKRKPIEDIDSLPLPDYEGFDIDTYLARQTVTDLDVSPYDHIRGIQIIASRSCPYNCSFCFHPLGNKYRKRSTDSVIAEIEYLVEKYKVNFIMLQDELFAGSKEEMAEFCERIGKLNIKWLPQLRVDRIDEETIIMLKKAGCIYISYGLESASPRILKSMRKKITIEQIEKALAVTRKHDLLIQGNFIFGDKAETLETIVETLNWWFKHPEYRINLSRLVAYPGTPLYKDAVKNGVIGPDRIEYLKNGCAKLNELNLTQIPDNAYNSMMSVILSELRPGNLLPGRFVHVEKRGCDPYQGYFYACLIECPNCGKQVEYTTVHSKYVKFALKNYGNFAFACRECNQRMTFMAPGIEMRLLHLLQAGPTGKFAILGLDGKSELLLRCCYTARKNCVLIIDDPENCKKKSVQGIPIERRFHNGTEYDFILQLNPSHAYAPQALTTIQKTGVAMHDVSDDFRFLDHYDSKEKMQEYFNFVSGKMNRAKQDGDLEEISFLLLDLLESFPDSRDVNFHLAENALLRKDDRLLFDICYTLACLTSPDDFDGIKQMLINIFNRLIQENRIEAAREIANVFNYNAHQENTVLFSQCQQILEQKQQ